MSGGRKPMDVNLAKKGKHWTKAEIETRKSQEVSVETPKSFTAPKWLGAEAKKLFQTYGKLLISSGLPVSKLDVGALARMCDAEALYAKAAEKRDRAMDEEDSESLALWMKTMASCEKIARGAANDLGCTVASRCRMVVPKMDTEEDDPLIHLLEMRHA